MLWLEQNRNLFMTHMMDNVDKQTGQQNGPLLEVI
jgi:hypothetical protein